MGAHADARQRNLASRGRSFTLRRQTVTTPAAYTTVTVTGFRRAYRPDQIAGAIQQGDWALEICNFEIAAASWPGPPRAGDEVLDGSAATYAVVGAAAVYEGEDLIGHTLQLRGGA